MIITFNSDTYPANRVYELSAELRRLELYMADKIPDFPFEIGVALRCLPDSIGRNTFRRFSAKDNCLVVDITVSQDRFKCMSKNERREILGHVMFDFVAESLRKQKNRLPKREYAAFMQIFEKWLPKEKRLQQEIFFP
jgi:hypothetical protein